VETKPSGLPVFPDFRSVNVSIDRPPILQIVAEPLKDVTVMNASISPSISPSNFVAQHHAVPKDSVIGGYTITTRAASVLHLESMALHVAHSFAEIRARAVGDAHISQIAVDNESRALEAVKSARSYAAFGTVLGLIDAATVLLTAVRAAQCMLQLVEIIGDAEPADVARAGCDFVREALAKEARMIAIV
jgi:hypothetical protein